MKQHANIYDYEDYAIHNPFMYHNNIEIVNISEETCRVKCKLTHESGNPYGYVHGGLMFTMADVICGIHARVDGNRYVTQSSHINFLRNTNEGEIYCDTEMVKRGRTMVVVRFKVTDDKGRLLAEGVVDMIRGA